MGTIKRLFFNLFSPALIEGLSLCYCSSVSGEKGKKMPQTLEIIILFLLNFAISLKSTSLF